jgi:LacI family transcriptional regulator, galactose operon repressor
MAPSKRPYAVTIDDVARRAGVSVSTVSRVVNHTAPVSDEAAARVQAAMRDLKYRPRAAARSLATRTTNTLGLLLTGIYGDFFTPLLSGIEQVAGDAGFDLLISTSRRASRDGLAHLLGAHNTDGLLVFADSLDEAGLAHYHVSGLPLILIHQSPPGDLNIPCVTVENKAASCRLVEHLIAVHGRHRIAFLRGPEAHEDSYWREIGYRQALEAAGLPFDPTLVATGAFDRDVAHRAVHDLLAGGAQPDAIFAGDDEAAVGVLAALSDAGRQVPDDIAVVGFDDQRLSAYLTPPLTTVRAPTEEVGRHAAHQLISLIRTGQAERLVLLPTELVIRRSCGC